MSLVLISLLLPVVLMIAAFAINIVYMELARTELQIATDVATRAAGRTLAVTGSKVEAELAAERLLTANPFCNQTLTLDAANIEFGVATRYSEAERYSFTRDNHNPNAVQLSSNGSLRVPPLFPTMGVPINFRPIKSAISTQMALDLSLVIDRSGSMAFATDEVSGAGVPAAAPFGWIYGMPVPPRARWTDAVNAVNGFLDLLSNTGQIERVSLSTYSTDAFADVALSEDYLPIKQTLVNHGTIFLGGATNIGGGMLAGLTTLSDKKLARTWATRVMIVLTDGIHNVGTDPITAANYLASQNVLIYTVTFSNEANIAQMQEVAKIGGGRHIHASNGSELIDAFNEIAHSLPTLITH